jgi:Zn-dependent protease with chaperone function
MVPLLLVATLLTAGLVAAIVAWALSGGPALLLGRIDAPLHEVPVDSRLARRVEDHASTLDVTTPTVTLVATDQPLALTVGVREETTTVVVSEGLLDLLPVAELDSVLVHELAHVARRDTWALTLLSIPVVVARRCRAIGLDYWGGSTDRPQDETVSTGRTRYVGPVSAGVLLGLSVFWYPLATISRTVIRRHSTDRELEADWIAAASTGPEPVINAITRIEDERARSGDADRLLESGLDVFDFVPAGRGGADGMEQQLQAASGPVAIESGPRQSVRVPDTDLRRRTLEGCRE